MPRLVESKCMDERSIGIIYELKQLNDLSLKDRVIEFMCHYSNSPRECYSDPVVLRLLQQTFCDLLDNARRPGCIVNDYFSIKSKPWNQDKNEIEILAMCLCMVQVAEFNSELNEYVYINGFKDLALSGDRYE